MSGDYKSNIIISVLVTVISGLLFVMFNPEVAQLTKALRDNLFETLVISFLVLIFVIVLRLHSKLNEKTTLK